MCYTKDRLSKFIAKESNRAKLCHLSKFYCLTYLLANEEDLIQRPLFFNIIFLMGRWTAEMTFYYVSSHLFSSLLEMIYFLTKNLQCKFITEMKKNNNLHALTLAPPNCILF